jgi:hypothetical protein
MSKADEPKSPADAEWMKRRRLLAYLLRVAGDCKESQVWRALFAELLAQCDKDRPTE